MSGPSGWTVARVRDDAARLHAGSADLVAGRAGPSPARAVRVMEATAPAIVLGRAEPDGHLDQDRLARAGLDVVRRPSGGGAVLVGPGRVVWLDVVVPAGDPLWSDDVGRAMWWIGEAWSAALADVGLGPGAVHRGPMVRNRWSDRVCFAGLGAGEVTVEVDGRPTKVVGIAQRRTRHGALFQCSAPVRWDPDAILDVLSLDDGCRRAGAAELAGAAVGVGALAAPLLEAVVARITAPGQAPDPGQLP